MKRTPLRSKPKRDPVSSYLRWEVFSHDGGCVLAFLEPGHICRDQWGNEHDPQDLPKLTIEHVKSELRMGKRGEEMVTLCWAANLRPPTKKQRAMFREYLAAAHPVPEPVA